jgi:hypothetical protein
MKKCWLTLPIVIITACLSVRAQDSTRVHESFQKPSWEFNAFAHANFIPDNFFVIPVFMADRDWLHLEARYNYEDFETVSLWGGYNFQGGSKLEWRLTPMAGLALGNTNAFALGIEATLNYRKFEFYSEGEALTSFESREENFIYFWSDLSYTPWDWLTLGLSGQRTRVYQTGKDLQKGLFAGFNYKNASLSTYFYNIGEPESFFWLLSAAVSF